MLASFSCGSKTCALVSHIITYHISSHTNPFLMVFLPFFIYYHLYSAPRPRKERRCGRLSAVAVTYRCAMVPMRSPVGCYLDGSATCHSEPKLCTVNDEPNRLRAPWCSIACFSKECTVAMLKQHMYAVGDAAPPTGVRLASMDVRLVRRDLALDQPKRHPSTEHLPRELGRSRGFLLHLYLPNCDAHYGARGFCTLRVGSRRAWRAPAPPRVTPFFIPSSHARR